MCDFCNNNSCADEFCGMPPLVDPYDFEENRIENRIHVAQAVMELQKKIIIDDTEIVIKGGFVRDGGYQKSGGTWAKGTSDIDLEIMMSHFPTFREDLLKVLKKMERELEKNDVFVQKKSQPFQTTYHSTYCFELYRWTLSYNGTEVDVDICYKPTYHLDFDVNALKLTTEGLTKWYHGVDFIDVLKNIEKKQFNVMWTQTWKAKQLGIILQRIHKMEQRGWKCLNFAEIGKYFDGTKDFSFLGKDPFYFTMMTKFNIKKDNEVQECKICDKMVKKGDFVLISSWCGHEHLHHHRCMMAEWMSLHSAARRNTKAELRPLCDKCKNCTDLF
jgi:predicted nucleotidyltransferase